MVRFKNRYLLVEFLQPSQLTPAFSGASPNSLEPSILAPGGVNEDENDEDDDDEEIPRQPSIPFLAPLPHANGTSPTLKLSDESGSVIYRAIRSCIQDVFGDEGWGRIASSFKGELVLQIVMAKADIGSLFVVIYHSPLTSLTMLRIARNHYRLLWSGLTLLTSVNNQSIVPRVLAVSGTIKKLQNAGITYHRALAARYLAVVVEHTGE